MIKYRCNRCKTSLESGEHLAGKEDFCPTCGTKFIVPQSSTFGFIAFLKSIPYQLKILISIVLIVIMLFTAFRDTWERDNNSLIKTNIKEIEKEISENKITFGIIKYNSLLTMINGHKIKDPELLKTIENVKNLVEPIKKQKEKERKELEALALKTKRDLEIQESNRLRARHEELKIEVPPDRYYRDRHGNIVSERDIENKRWEVRRNIAVMEDEYEKAYYEGVLEALEDEWERIKSEGPINPNE